MLTRFWLRRERLSAPMANRQNFTRAVLVEMAKRCTRPDGQMACERCGAIGVRLEAHHGIMDAMKSAEAKKRRLTAADGEMICVPCHQPETARQRKELARAEASEARHLGVHRARKPFRSRGFPPAVPKDRTVTKHTNGVNEIARRFAATED